MAQEHTFSDFSGGMNALAAVDKLDPKECLLAENVRLDEAGNIQSAGAYTRQNSIVYDATWQVGGIGHTSNVINSLYWNPSFGCVAGVGASVFFGRTLGGMTQNTNTGVNLGQQKMSFASAPNRVYFDLGSIGWWTDIGDIYRVDWAPPVSVGAIVTGPTVVAGGTQTSQTIYYTMPWDTTANIASLSSNTTATCTFSGTVDDFPNSEYLVATMGTSSFAISTVAVSGIAVTIQGKSTLGTPTASYLSNDLPDYTVSLLKNGVPVGNPEYFLPQASGVWVPMSFGGSSDMWGTDWAQADINSGAFGFQITAGAGAPNSMASVYQGQVTIYQGTGGIAAGTGAGGDLSGAYTWKVTFVAANGEESDASNDTNQVTLSAQQGTLTAIQLGDARTVARNIYRLGGSLTSHYLVGTIQNNLSTTYSDNVTDIVALAQGSILAGDVPGDSPNTRLGTTPVRFPAYHYDRVFWVNQSQQNQIIWSKPLNGFAYPAVNFINVGDSKPITRLISIFGELIIIKTDSIWRLTGTDESSFDLTQTPSDVGTDMSFTVVALPDKILFANRIGPWVFNGYTSTPLTPKLDMWFRQQDRTSKSLFGVNGFHPPEIASASVPLNFEAVGNSEKYYLAYAEAGQTANNSLLVFDVKHGNISKRVTGGTPAAIAIDPVTGFVYMGDVLGYVSLLDDWNGATQGGSATNFDYQHGYQDLQRGSNKALWALEFYINTNGQSLTPSVYYDGGQASETLAALSSTSLQRIVRPVEGSVARKMQNFSWRLNGSLTSVNVSGTPQIEIVSVKALYDIRTGRARTGQ